MINPPFLRRSREALDQLEHRFRRPIVVLVLLLAIALVTAALV